MAGPRRAPSGVVAASGLDWTIVRPPAVYGPGDRETFELFKMAQARPRRAAAQGPLLGHPCRGSLPADPRPGRRARHARRDLRARRRPREWLGAPPFRPHPGPRLRQARRDRRDAEGGGEGRRPARPPRPPRARPSSPRTASAITATPTGSSPPSARPPASAVDARRSAPRPASRPRPTGTAKAG